METNVRTLNGVVNYSKIEFCTTEIACTLGAGVQLWYYSPSGYKVTAISTATSARPTLGGNHALKAWKAFIRLAIQGEAFRVGLTTADVQCKIKNTAPDRIVFVALDGSCQIVNTAGCIFSKLGFLPTKARLLEWANGNSATRGAVENQTANESMQAILKSAEIIADVRNKRTEEETATTEPEQPVQEAVALPA